MKETLDVADFRALVEQPVKVEDLLADLLPPPHFRGARFSSYIPDDRFPSQSAAVAEITTFIASIRNPKRHLLSFLLPQQEGRGLYLDGGFGIGKTHLLAAAFHQFGGTKAYLTFQELMFLVGLQGLSNTVATFSKYSLLVIDEFELDDPANTRISTNLLGQLFRSGTSVISSSNTPPGALGEGKFSVESFKREIGDLFTYFTTLRIEGEDYRRSARVIGPQSNRISSGSQWYPAGSALPKVDKQTLTLSHDDLLATLALAHPIRVRKAMLSFEAIQLEAVKVIDEAHSALRFVYFIDKAYDNDLALSVSSAVAIESLFSPAIYQGGDTKKYLRTISRLHEMTRAPL